MDIRLYGAILLGKSINLLTRFFKIGGGSAAPGLYALKIDPDLVEKLARQVPSHIIITGTNGKTTTAKILAHLLENQDKSLIRNATGSNMERGIASAMLHKSSLFGKIKNIDLGIWELDEVSFNKMALKIKPGILVFLNAFRDQLDRYGEVDTVVKNWQKTLEKINWPATVILNGNDGNTLSLAQIRGIQSKIFFLKGSVLESEKTVSGNDHRKADFTGEVIENHGLKGNTVLINYPQGSLKINFKIPGVYQIYNLLATLSVYHQLNFPLEKVNSLLDSFFPAFGRFEQVNLDGKTAYLFLIKNPAGASLVFETISPILKKSDGLLLALNDNFADGTDVSWIWDAHFEELQNAPGDFKTIVSGTRAYDLALRLKYAGFNQDHLILEPDLKQALIKAKTETKGSIFILPTYTALLGLQKILSELKVKKHYWRES